MGCGNNEFQFVEGVLTYTACGSKNKNIKKEEFKNEYVKTEYINFDEKLIEEEIKRLMQPFWAYEKFTKEKNY